MHKPGVQSQHRAVIMITYFQRLMAQYVLVPLFPSCRTCSPHWIRNPSSHWTLPYSAKAANKFISLFGVGRLVHRSRVQWPSPHWTLTHSGKEIWFVSRVWCLYFALSWRVLVMIYTKVAVSNVAYLSLLPGDRRKNHPTKWTRTPHFMCVGTYKIWLVVVSSTRSEQPVSY